MHIRSPLKHNEFTPVVETLSRCNFFAQWKRINSYIEDAIVTADKQGVKVFGLGALNKNEALNGGGALFVKNNPHLKVRVVHGNTLTAAAVLQKIPEVVAKIMSFIPVSVVPVSVFHDDCVSRRCDDVVVLTRVFNCTNRAPSRPSFSEPPPSWDGKLPSHSRHDFSPNLPRLCLLENLHLGKSK